MLTTTTKKTTKVSELKSIAWRNGYPRQWLNLKNNHRGRCGLSSRVAQTRDLAKDNGITLWLRAMGGDQIRPFGALRQRQDDSFFRRLFRLLVRAGIPAVGFPIKACFTRGGGHVCLPSALHFRYRFATHLLESGYDVR